MEITYYPDGNDELWKTEIAKIMPYCDSQGIDIGCGGRTLHRSVIRCDIDQKLNPDICCSGEKLPCKDEEFDFIVSVHSFEHFDNQDAVLKEWLRVLRIGGIISIVHPDVKYTKEQRPVDRNECLRDNPYYKHYHERTLNQFVSWCSKRTKLGFRIIDSGVALGAWSFYIILKKTKVGEK